MARRPGPKANPEENKPRTEPFSLATDPFTMETSHEVAGLYLAPPERVLALHVDAETVLRPKLRAALETLREEPLPAAVTALLESLDSTTEKVTGTLHRRRRGVAFRQYLAKLDQELPEGGEVHLICDNYFTHKSPTVINWLRAHPRFVMHFAPDEAAWLAHVERWFAYQAAREGFHGDKSSAVALSAGIAEWRAGDTQADEEGEEGASVGVHVWVKPRY
ncbi:transposase [Kitasatospora sp. NPDC058170]|uniref:transposase n=1 Tax=Kitasatospora sp. NPDC058170 TaxID=3346364 RepID=UPI0036DC010B